MSTKIHSTVLFPAHTKKMLNSLKKSFDKTTDKWIVVNNNGIWYFATEQDAKLERQKQRDAGLFTTHHHVLDITF
jgi:hypothetical protein